MLAVCDGLDLGSGCAKYDFPKGPAATGTNGSDRAPWEVLAFLLVAGGGNQLSRACCSSRPLFPCFCPEEWKAAMGDAAIPSQPLSDLGHGR